MKLIKSLHKWLSVLVALQLLIWLSTGLYFNLMDHDKARGKTYRTQAVTENKINHSELIEPSTLLSRDEFKQGSVNEPFNSIHSIKLIYLLSQPYYLLNHQKSLYPHFFNEHTLIHAVSGKTQVIDSLMAQLIAKSTYNGQGKISSSVLLHPPIADFPKEKNVVWKNDFSDELETSVYIDASSGRLVGHSNINKRFSDFFFMLHFMDYGYIGSFNNWQIIFFALLTLLFCFTGATWVVSLVRKGRYL